MGFFKKLLGRGAAPALDRRTFLLRHGRITEGIILESEGTNDDDALVYYLYTLNGVDMESSDRLTEDQMRNIIKYAPGAKVNVRYDPRNQGNSIVE